jgi:uncharacterized damage-inducible protein DinB
VHTTSAVFTRFAAAKLRQYVERIETCVARLDDGQLWLRGSENSNAAGNLCIHLAGNVRQWILHGVAGQPDIRDRDGEFAARGGVSREEMLGRLRAVVAEACEIIESQDEESLGRVVRPQNYEVRVLEAIFHVVEHFAQHTGQIIYVTKALTGEDLGFYRHLTGTREPPPPPAGGETP